MKGTKSVHMRYLTRTGSLYFENVTGVERGVYTCIVYDEKFKSFTPRGYGELIIGGTFSKNLAAN